MNLQKGQKGSAVKIWQNFLITQGFIVTADGDFGPATEKKTKAFQAANGLREDGIVGDGTLAAAKEKGFAETLVEKVVAEPAPSHLEIFTSGSRVDQINQAKLAKVSPTLQTRGRLFIEAARAVGVEVQIVQGLRTFAEQDGLYAQGRSKPGKRVTNARGGFSNHNFGLALDFAPVVNGVVSWDEKLYRPFAEWASAAGLEWGGNWTKFRDLPHVQDANGMSLADIQSHYRRGGLAAVWAKVS